MITITDGKIFSITLFKFRRDRSHQGRTGREAEEQRQRTECSTKELRFE